MRTMIPYFLFFARLCFLLPFVLYSEKTIPPEMPFPWFTGPLLAPSSNVVPLGSIDIEPYVYATNYTGNYNSHWNATSQPHFFALSWQLTLQAGLASWLDCQSTPSFTYNHTSGAAQWVVNDLPLQFDVQLLTESDEQGSLLPSIKLTLGEIFPIGTYQQLNAHKHLTDSGGSGSFTTFCGITFGKLLYFTSAHFLNIRANVSYQLPAPVHVKGFNSYGGGGETDGTIYPSQTLSFDGAFEYTLTRNWILACDVVGAWSSPTRFSGELGPSASLNSPHSSIQISIAPAIEYNWSDALGVIIGPWWTLAGKNSNKFYSIVAAVNYYY